MKRKKMNITFQLPKSVESAQVTIQDAGADWTVSVCLDVSAEATAEPESAPTASVAVLAPAPVDSPDERRRVAARDRKRRERDRKRDMSHNVTPDVTQKRDMSHDVTPNVTQKRDMSHDVTRDSVTYDDCLIDCNINNINNINLNTTNQSIIQQSVTRHTSRPVSRRAPPEGQLWLPLVPELDNLHQLDTPKIREAWRRWVRWRQTTKGVRYVSWNCYTDMLDTLQTAFTFGREAAVLEVLDYAIRAERVNVLVIPESAIPTVPAPDPCADDRVAHARAEAEANAQRDLDARLRAIGYIPDTRAWQRGPEAVAAEEARRQSYLDKLENLIPQAEF